MILTVRMLGPVPSATEKQEPMLELLETADQSPGRLVRDLGSVADVMAPIASALGIDLYIGPMLALDFAREDLFAAILH